MSPAGMRNNEGYFDPTAGLALRSIERTEKRMEKIRRGDIVYVEKYGAAAGSEQYADRPALVVSNDKCNIHSDVIEVVYLTTAPKTDLPTHVKIRSTPKESTALCEQITSISKSRVRNFMCAASAEEMTQIDIALLISLDLTMGAPEAPAAPQKAPEPTPPPKLPEKPVAARLDFEVAYRAEKAEKEKLVAGLEKRLVKTEAELAIYKELYADMTDRAFGRAANA